MGLHNQVIRRRASVRLMTALAVVAALLVASPALTRASAADGDVGYEDQSFSGVSNPPTEDKPQSKLWHNDGSWWAVMYDRGSRSWHIFRLDRPTETWVDTEVRVDDRRQTLSDVLWDGNKLYVASHWVTVSSEGTVKPSQDGRPARLYRYSYDAGQHTYSLDSGFPATINDMSSESLTIDKDTTGTLWATWTQVSGSSASGYVNKVYVSSTAGSDLTWRTPTVLPAAGADTLSPDDISAVVAFGANRIGVLWSNQTDDTMYWAVHRDGDDPGQWRGSVALRGKKQADDHINLKALLADQQGRVFAVAKTSLDELSGAPKSSAQILLLVFRPGTGAWSSTVFGTLADCHTRPQLLLDDEHQIVHVFATAPTSSGCPYAGAPGTIYTKSAPMDDPVFPPGRGIPVITDADSAHVNNVTSTKQSVNSATGIVVLAANDSTDRYWHADIPLTGEPPVPPAPAPVSGFTASTTAGTAPLDVQFTDTSTNTPTSWAWDFGDGASATAQNPQHTYTTAGSYVVSLTASNASGAGAPATRTINVDAAPPPPPGGSGVVRATFSTAVSPVADGGLTIDAPSGIQAGDVLVSCVVMNGSSISDAPAGWTGFAASTGISNPRVYGYYRVADGSEPASYRWAFNRSVTSSGGIARYTGAADLDGAAATASGASAKVGTVPGVTTTVAGDMLVGCMGINSSASSIDIAGPTALSEVWDIGAKRHEYDDGVQAAAGPSGPLTWTFSSGREWAGWLVALKPS